MLQNRDSLDTKLPIRKHLQHLLHGGVVGMGTLLFHRDACDSDVLLSFG
jgi:hypothetical protein